MADRLRVGLVGGGPWARRVHAPGLAAHSNIDFAAVWTRRPAVAAGIARDHGAAPFDDVGALIDSVDAVAFAVPPEVQADIAIDAARAGRHLILDKPIAGSVARAEQLAAAVDATGVASIVMLTLRYAPETREWLEEIAATGEWKAGSAHWLSGALLGGEYAQSPWRHASGAITDIGPHAVDLLDAALGPVVDVVAASHSEPDVWHVLLEHEGGVVSAMSLSMMLPLDSSVVEVEVYGAHGRRPLVARETTADDCYATMLDEFAAMVRGGVTSHPCDVRRGLHLQRIIEAARHAALTPRPKSRMR